jgi:hypothetical protein
MGNERRSNYMQPETWTEYPRVTQILKDMGLERIWGTDEHRDKGTAVHEICHLLDKNRAPVWSYMSVEELEASSAWQRETTSPELIPYANAWLSFLFEVKPDFTHIEHRLVSELYHFTGTIDRYSSEDRVLTDIKTTTPHPAATIQLGMYSMLLEENGSHVSTARVVELRPNGKYKIHPVNLRDARQLGVSAINLWWWRKQHGLLNGKEKQYA